MEDDRSAPSDQEPIREDGADEISGGGAGRVRVAPEPPSNSAGASPISVTEIPEKKAKRRDNVYDRRKISEGDLVDTSDSLSSAEPSNAPGNDFDQPRHILGDDGSPPAPTGEEPASAPEDQWDEGIFSEVLSGDAVRSDFDGTATLFSDATHMSGAESPFLLKTEKHITAAAALGGGLAVCCDDRDIILWDNHSGIYARLRGSGARVSCLASTPSARSDGHLLATGREDGAVAIYELQKGSRKGTTLAEGRQKPILDLHFLPRGTALAAVNVKRQCQLWSLADGSCVCSLEGERPELSKGQEFQLMTACFSHGGNSLASVAEGSRYIHFWKRGKRERLAGHESSPDAVGRQGCRIRALGFSPDGKYLASAANDHTVRMWEIQKDDSPCSRIIHAHGALTSLAFSPDSNLIAGGCADGTIEVWDVGVSSNEVSWTFSGTIGSVKTLVFIPDGKTLASVGWCDCTLRLWSLERRRLLHMPILHA